MTTYTTAPDLTRTDTNVDFNWMTNSPGTGVNADYFTVRWEGQIYIPSEASAWTFYTDTDDGARLYIDGKIVISAWGVVGTTASAATNLTMGWHDLVCDAVEFSGSARARLYWSGPTVSSQTIIPSANLQTGSVGSRGIALDAVSSAKISDANPLTFSHTVGNHNNRILIVGAIGRERIPANTLASSVTYGGQTMTAINNGKTQGVDPGDNEHDTLGVRMFYLLNPASGTAVVTVNYPTENRPWRSAAYARSYYNAKQAAPEAIAQNGHDDSYPTASVEVTTLSNNAMVLDCMAWRDATLGGLSLYPGYKPFVSIKTVNPVDRITGLSGQELWEPTGGTTVTVPWTWINSNKRWAQQAIVLAPATFTVTFDAQNGSTPNPASNVVTCGMPYGALAATTRTGYTFGGWWTATDGGGTQVLDSTRVDLTGNQILYAKWTINTYTVSFQTDGTAGATLAGTTPQSVNHGTNCTAVTANEPESHHFVKWTKSGADFSTANPLAVTNVTEPMTLTAVYAINQYAVTFQTDGTAGAALTGTTPQSVNHGTNCTAVTANEPESHHFVKWTEGGADFSTANPLTVTNVTEPMTLIAVYAINTYSISGAVFWAGSGLSGVSITGLPGTPATSGSGAYSATVDYGFSGTATPVLAGYTFSPPSIAFSAVGADQSGQNFTAKANQTISFEPLPAKTYGDAPFGLEASASSGLPVSYVSSDTGVATVSGVTVTLVGAGETTITASQPGNANYNAAAPVPQSLTVNKASATVSLSNLAHTYDGTAKSATATTTPPGLTVTITYNGSATAPTNAGSYAVAATINDANYQGNASGTLSIAKAAATVSLSNLAHTYDGMAKSATATTTPPGLTVDITYDGAAAAPANAGDYDVVATVNDVNYQGSAGDAMRINKATATVALSGLNQTYDGAPKPIGAATTPAGLAVDITYNGQPTAPTNAGSYPVAAAVNEANYQGTASDTLVIAKAASVISEAPTASDITYGQTLADSGLSGGTGTPSGAFAFTTPATMPNAGTAAQPVTFTPVDTLNYTAAAGTASVTVNPKTLTVAVVNNPTKLYDGNPSATLNPDNNFQVSGLVSGQSVTITETAGVYDSTEIGAHTVTVALEAGDFTAGAGTDLANYTLPTQATGPGTITDKFIPVITIPPTAGAITYGQTLAASSLTGGEARYGGAVVTGTFEFTDDSIAPDAGTYNASVTFTPADTVTYASASANAAVTVNKAAATVTLSDLSHTYDGVAHPATVTTSPEGLGVDITYGGAAAAPMNAGTYAVVATIDDANYQGTAADTLVIAPAALTVTADAKSKMAGEADPALTYQITAGALVPGDALSGALTREPGEAVGTYAILQGTLTAGPNYDLTYVGADLTITSNEVFTVVYTGPNPVVAPLDGRVEISVTAVNYTGEVDYQWHRVRPDKALQLIEGATGPMLVIEPVTLDDAGFYICEATWEGGFDLSPEIEVRVEETSSLPAAGLLGAGVLFVTLSLAGVRAARRRTPHTA